ncbi:MAG: hypothetical protein JNL10_06410 [Verrucomicrobiales bacterium]|nr:hypothetical protein [Verrucomicrobiales bacterium]
MTGFHRYVGIDYSGAGTPTQGLPGLRVSVATRDHGPREVLPPSGTRSLWTRKGLAHWLAATLREGPPTLVGVDHGFSFPLRYFETHRIPTA